MQNFQMSDGGLWGFIIGGLMETVQQAHIALFSSKEKGQQPQDPNQPKPEVKLPDQSQV